MIKRHGVVWASEEDANAWLCDVQVFGTGFCHIAEDGVHTRVDPQKVWAPRPDPGTDTTDNGLHDT